ncbi:MAG: DNA/RNA nuclease SfsA [Rickettsiales bacterium]|jgi:sugar fermentation stimulation protein A|nr:DNA/RNA nuclease SfsA [Rickettsiales bacterium]
MVFEEALREGLIINRPNRFVMNVMVDGVLSTCHCPCTGRIGRIIFDRVPCLLSSAPGSSGRKTNYTVEAVSLNRVNDPHKKWVGINQTRANSYVDYFLRSGQLSAIVGHRGKNFTVQREQRVGNSRIDFVVNNDLYLEVKSPMVMLPLKEKYVTNENLRFMNRDDTIYSIDRFIKHMDELSRQRRAVFLVFFMFEADAFIPKPEVTDSTVGRAVQKTKLSGVDFWQVNTKFTKRGISLVDYYRMPL